MRRRERKRVSNEDESVQKLKSSRIEVQPLETTSPKKSGKKCMRKWIPNRIPTRQSRRQRELCVSSFCSLDGRLHSHTLLYVDRRWQWCQLANSHTTSTALTTYREMVFSFHPDQYGQPQPQHHQGVMSLALCYALRATLYAVRADAAAVECNAADQNHTTMTCDAQIRASNKKYLLPIDGTAPYLLLRQMRRAMGCPAIRIAPRMLFEYISMHNNVII